jgi:putative IMPACT (imprinted ancient) family translation regulator
METEPPLSIPAGRARNELTIKKSRFVATIGPASSPSVAREAIEAVRREFPGAHHHCWAYFCTPMAKGAGDDGEPAGTAGRPMLAVLSGSGIGQVVAVVTRFFGVFTWGAEDWYGPIQTAFARRWN